MIGQTCRWKSVCRLVPAWWAMVVLIAWGQVRAAETPVVEVGEGPGVGPMAGPILIPAAGLEWPAAPVEGIDSFEFYGHGDPSFDDAGVHLPPAGVTWPENQQRLAADDDHGTLIVPEPTAVLFLAIGAVLLAMTRTGPRGAHSRPT